TEHHTPSLHDALPIYLHWYLRTLEQALIDALAELGIAGVHNPGHTGVWTRGEGGVRKIASIGVHVKQWVTWHGFALNATTDLARSEEHTSELQSRVEL